ncbi:MAG: bifunctional UDP-N-acetylglucosamine diphosphorylase/glucosamine-1-phosphate N-acetyltransferase GlmU [bacterium]|jgi:bifunctional UDP-N-acetylglucosamine pyrophosphorylase/glucosamine-1-phosphate N-acetyltransferase
MSKGVMAVVLAAGKGKRMKSRLPKVMHRVCGKPMLAYVLEAAREAGVNDIIVVISPEGEMIRETFGDQVRYVYQRERLGTGHAVLQAVNEIPPEVDTLLVLSGDTPLLSPQLLQDLLATHRAEAAAATLVTTRLPDPTGYGRIVRDQEGRVLRIVEETDAGPGERAIKEVNAGVYAFQRQQLFAALAQLTPANAQGEYYLTDVLTSFRQQGLVVAVQLCDRETVLGVNNRVQLAQVEQIVRRRVLEELMLAGVTIIDPNSTFIETGVEIGQDTVIYPFTIIGGSTKIGEGCSIGPSSRLSSVWAGPGVRVEYSVLTDCRLEAGAVVGPYAYLRPGAVLDQGAKAGTFVEIKKSQIGKNSKVPHLSYVGDTIIAEEVNIGAGTITCNYDGWEKHQTRIDRGAFIGSNTNLVAPVRIGKRAITGAGSTITRDVPDYALALERSEQKTIPDWMKKKLREKGQWVED